jgi:hypothetical protein
MTLKPLQAFGIALALGGAALVGSATLPLVSTAQAATVRPAVGRPLQAAISLANQGQAGAALAKVREAESVSGLTGSEQAAIAQTRAYIGAKTGAGGSAVGCKAKFANDYNGGRYREVVGEDADCLRKSGGYGYSDEIIVAQAYYLMGDYNTAIRMLRGMGDSDQVLSLLMSAAGKAGDTQTEGAVAERLILKGQSKYWTYLLAAADNTRGLTDHENLDIYRVRYATGSMRNSEDYELMTQLAIQLGFSQEAQGVAQKGFDVKLLQGERDTRLLNLAKTQAAKDSANLANLQKQAEKAKNGDLFVKLGENLWGYGKTQDAVTAIQAGIKKGATQPNDAQMALGIALLSAGQKDAALRAFTSVKGTPAAQTVAHLWSVYTRAGGSAPPPAASDQSPKPATGHRRH